MGMYTAVALDLKFKRDVPLEVVALIQKYVDCDGPDGPTNSLFCGHSFDFKEWEVREWRQYLGQWVLKSRASTKSPEERTIRMFMTVMEPFLDIAPETVVVRTLFVEGVTETVYYYDAKGEIVKESGWRYKDYWEGDHPRQSVDFEPPSNIHELRKAITQKKLDRDSEWGYYGN